MKGFCWNPEDGAKEMSSRTIVLKKYFLSVWIALSNPPKIESVELIEFIMYLFWQHTIDSPIFAINRNLSWAA